MHPECMDVTNMSVIGTLTTNDGKYNATAVSGSFMVTGLTFDGIGDLNLTLADNSTLSAMINNRVSTSCSWSSPSAETQSCTLNR